VAWQICGAGGCWARSLLPSSVLADVEVRGDRRRLVRAPRTCASAALHPEDERCDAIASARPMILEAPRLSVPCRGSWSPELIAKEDEMETKPLLLVGVYDSKADADTDYGDAKVLNRNGFFGILDAAVITKDDNGHDSRQPGEKTTRQGAAADRWHGHRDRPHHDGGPLDQRWCRSRRSCRGSAPNGVDNLLLPVSVTG
jgi:hypothetical protein